MKLGVDAAGDRRTIDVRRSPDGWVATIGDRRLSVSLARAGSRWSVLVGPPGEPPTASHEVALAWSSPGAWLVDVDGCRVPVTVAGADASPAPQAPPGGGSVVVVAPMPGRVVQVLVSPGQVVAAGQALVVVEAMKMENDVTAPVAGTVIEVPATEGVAVGGRAVLAVLEPKAEANREP
jgi:glutaconyl-CoA decarboxylase